jgi:hypothetical protein
MEVLPDFRPGARTGSFRLNNNTFNYIDPYPVRATAHVSGQPDAEAIRGEMAAIPDREGGNILNIG